MISIKLVVGASAAERELVIADTLSASSEVETKTAVLIEGLASGQPVLLPSKNLFVSRVAAGCICCNNPAMQVHLNRLIRQKPQRLFLSLASDLHIQQIRDFLATANYQKVLELAGEINLKSIIQ